MSFTNAHTLVTHIAIKIHLSSFESTGFEISCSDCLLINPWRSGVIYLLFINACPAPDTVPSAYALNKY